MTSEVIELLAAGIRLQCDLETLLVDDAIPGEFLDKVKRHIAKWKAVMSKYDDKLATLEYCKNQITIPESYDY